MSSASGLGLLEDLPYELRLMIYERAFVFPKPRENSYTQFFGLESVRMSSKNELLTASKDVHAEARGVFYAKNFFTLRRADLVRHHIFSPTPSIIKAVHAVRNIRIEIRATCVYPYYTEWQRLFDDWPSEALPNLREVNLDFGPCKEDLDLMGDPQYQKNIIMFIESFYMSKLWTNVKSFTYDINGQISEDSMERSLRHTPWIEQQRAWAGTMLKRKSSDVAKGAGVVADH